MKNVNLIFSKNVPGVQKQTITLGLNVGSEGKSAYEVAVENGYEGTEAEWLNSLIGKSGADGADGVNGKSAYELACENGFEGSLSEWLDSLAFV